MKDQVDERRNQDLLTLGQGGDRLRRAGSNYDCWLRFLCSTILALNENHSYEVKVALHRKIWTNNIINFDDYLNSHRISILESSPDKQTTLRKIFICKIMHSSSYFLDRTGYIQSSSYLQTFFWQIAFNLKSFEILSIHSASTPERFPNLDWKIKETKQKWIETPQESCPNEWFVVKIFY